MKVVLCVEGGGTNVLNARCRKSFSDLIERAGFRGRMPRIVACGSREDAFDTFRTHHASGQGYTILLVDSETPVESLPWEHLQKHDRWERPAGARDEQAQLMVVCMETWIVADREALQSMFGQGWRSGGLLPVAGLEQRSKQEVQESLKTASQGCPLNRRYEKGRRSFELLGRLDPVKLRELPHFQRFCEVLEDKLEPPQPAR